MINNPFDKAIKFALKNKEGAENFFRNFLPAFVVKKLDFETLELDDRSYIDENLEEDYSDIVYNIIWGENVPIKISLLLEHKSYRVSYPHFQKLRYMLNIWEFQLTQKQKPRPVLPIVLYHDKEEWNVRSMYDYFEDLDEDLKQFIPHFEYLFINLTKYSDEQIMQIKVGFLMSTLLLSKHKKDRQYLEEHYKEVFLFLKSDLDDETKNTYTKTLFIFIRAIYGLIKEDFVSLSQRLSNFENNNNMDTLDFFEEDLITLFDKGEAAGEAIGEAIGEFKNAIKTISNLIQKLPLLTDEQIAEIAEQNISLVKKIREEIAAGRDPKITLNPEPTEAKAPLQKNKLLEKYIDILNKRFPKWTNKKIANLLEEKEAVVEQIRENLPPPLRGFAGVENPFDKEIEKVLNAHQAFPISKTFVKQLLQAFPDWSTYTISELAVVTIKFVEQIKKDIEGEENTDK